MNYKTVLNKIFISIGTVALAFGVLFLFFGGTWEGVRFALEFFGAVLLQHSDLQFSSCIAVEKREHARKFGHGNGNGGNVREREKVDSHHYLASLI